MFKGFRIPVGPLCLAVLPLVAALSSKSNSEKWEVWLPACRGTAQCESARPVLRFCAWRGAWEKRHCGLRAEQSFGVRYWLSPELGCQTLHSPQILLVGQTSASWKRAGKTYPWKLEASQQQQEKDNTALLVCFNAMSSSLRLSYLSLCFLHRLWAFSCSRITSLPASTSSPAWLMIYGTMLETSLQM